MLALGDAAQPAIDRRPFGQQDPPLAPDDRRQFLDQMPLGHARRPMLLDQRRQQVGKLGLIFMRQDRQLGQNAVFQGIEAHRLIVAMSVPRERSSCFTGRGITAFSFIDFASVAGMA